MVIRSRASIKDNILSPHSVPPIIDLPQGDEDSNWRPACYFCGESLHSTEPSVIISRNLETSREVLDSAASFQSCLPCALKAVFEQLEPIHKPKLTIFEIHAFKEYSLSLARGIAEVTSGRVVEEGYLQTDILLGLGNINLWPITTDIAGGSHYGQSPILISPNQCIGCFKPIDLNAPHVSSFICIEVKKNRTIHQHSLFNIGNLCLRCAMNLSMFNPDTRHIRVEFN